MYPIIHLFPSHLINICSIPTLSIWIDSPISPLSIYPLISPIYSSFANRFRTGRVQLPNFCRPRTGLAALPSPRALTQTHWHPKTLLKLTKSTMWPLLDPSLRYESNHTYHPHPYIYLYCTVCTKASYTSSNFTHSFFQNSFHFGSFRYSSCYASALALYCWLACFFRKHGSNRDVIVSK